MRKVLAGAAIAAALAWAPAARADDKKADDKKADSTHMQQPGSQSAGTAAGRETATGGQDRTSRDMRSDTRAGATQEKDKKGEFEGKKNFDVDGKVRSASANEVTIERKDGLPPMKLKVGSDTKIEVDGKRASADQLQPGQDVKASFNMKGDSPEAVELKAKKADEKAGQKLHEQQRENQQERAKDAEKKY